jgi:hypothetical protein
MFRKYNYYPRWPRRSWTFGAEGEDVSRTPHDGGAPTKGRGWVAWGASGARSSQGGVGGCFVTEGATWTVAMARSEGVPRHVSVLDV